MKRNWSEESTSKSPHFIIQRFGIKKSSFLFNEQAVLLTIYSNGVLIETLKGKKYQNTFDGGLALENLNGTSKLPFLCLIKCS